MIGTGPCGEGQKLALQNLGQLTVRKFKQTILKTELRSNSVTKYFFLPLYWQMFEFPLWCLYRCCASLSFVPEAWRDWSADKHILLGTLRMHIALEYQTLIYCALQYGYFLFYRHFLPNCFGEWSFQKVARRDFY